MATMIFPNSSNPSHHRLKLITMTAEIPRLKKVGVNHFVDKGFANLASVHIFISKNTKAKIDFGRCRYPHASISFEMTPPSRRGKATIPRYRDRRNLSSKVSKID
jgi:hypothetical protein